MANPTVSFQVPQELLNQITVAARISGKNKTDLFIEGLYLSLSKMYSPEEDCSSSSDLSILHQKIELLQDQAARHSAQLATLRQSVDRHDSLMIQSYLEPDGVCFQ